MSGIFTPDEEEALQANVAELGWFSDLLKRAEALRIRELTDEPAALDLYQTYVDQIRTVRELERELMDYRLERAAGEVERCLHEIRVGFETMNQLQGKLADLVNLHYEARFGRAPDDAR